MQKTPWMEQLKIGDEVLLVNRDYYSFGKVTGISRKCVYVNGQRYSKWMGKERGILEMTDENLEKRHDQREDRLNYIESYGKERSRYENLDDVKLYEAYDALKYAAWLKDFDAKFNKKFE